MRNNVGRRAIEVEADPNHMVNKQTVIKPAWSFNLTLSLYVFASSLHMGTYAGCATATIDPAWVALEASPWSVEHIFRFFFDDSLPHGRRIPTESTVECDHSLIGKRFTWDKSDLERTNQRHHTLKYPNWIKTSRVPISENQTDEAHSADRG